MRSLALHNEEAAPVWLRVFALKKLSPSSCFLLTLSSLAACLLVALSPNFSIDCLLITRTPRAGIAADDSEDDGSASWELKTRAPLPVPVLPLMWPKKRSFSACCAGTRTSASMALVWPPCLLLAATLNQKSANALPAAGGSVPACSIAGRPATAGAGEPRWVTPLRRWRASAGRAGLASLRMGREAGNARCRPHSDRRSAAAHSHHVLRTTRAIATVSPTACDTRQTRSITRRARPIAPHLLAAR